MQLVGFVGFQNSGKNTAALILEDLGYKQISFAESLKDCLAAIFQWPRDMLDGTTPESRVWREQVDSWWAERLGIPTFTPRMAMQQVGTGCLRRHFNEDMWVFSVERKILANPKQKYVFTDLRYPNEIALVKRMGGKVLRVKKGDEPMWFDIAASNVEQMPILFPHVHETEYAWIGQSLDGIITNDGSIDMLHLQVLQNIFGE
jgi:hypothetical protein